LTEILAWTTAVFDLKAWRNKPCNQYSVQGRWKPFLTAFAIFVTVASASGQTPSTGKPNTETDDSKEAFIIEKLRTAASFENDGASSRTTTSEVRVQSEAGVQHWGVLSAPYSSANEQVEIGYVRVRKADGTVVETPTDSAQDVTSEIMRAAPMYSDYHEKHVAVKGLGVGDKLEYQITVRLHTPLIPGQFWYAYDFEKGNIVLDEEVEVNVPRDRELKVKSPGLAPEIVESGNRRIYTWKAANHRAAKQEARREFPPPQILLSTFRSWEELGRWWNGLAQDRVATTPEIRAKAEELIRSATTREEKVRALYDYVSMRFRYISISFGIGRYQPHAAGDVLKNEYGDCKDKHTLLAALLEAAGIEAYPALMNSSRHIDPDVPSPGQFDHVITAVPDAPNSPKFLWMDATAEVGPFGYLAFPLRDKQALVIPHAQPPMLVATPADPPFKCFRRFEIDAKLSDTGILEGTMQRSFRGDSELILRALFRQVPQTQWKDLVQGIAQGMGFAGDVSEVEVGSLEDTSQPFHFSNKYTRKDYPDWANHRITPPFGFVGFPEIKDDEERTQPILLGGREEITDIAKVELPKGYAPRLLPGVDRVSKFAEYHSTYTFKEGVFVAEIRLVIKQTEMPLSALKDYQAFQKAISDDREQYTELSYGAEALHAPSPSANREADELLQDAREAFLRRDLDSASDLLDRALKLDDHYPQAWMMLGSVRLAQRRTKEGLTALHKAIESDPQNPQSYKMLAFTYMQLHRPEEAMPVWRDLLKQDPNNVDAHTNLGSTLLSLKRYGEAVPQLEAAVALNKPSSNLNIALARAYIGAGNPDKAVVLLKKAADMTLDPVAWNDAAYYLGDNNLSLPDAQLYAEKAVKSVESDAANVSLDRLDVGDLNRMSQLAHFWDTLGWIYFREGDFAKAQKYLEAAWNLAQEGTIGDHLAQTYEKQGKKLVANYQHALAHVAPDPNAVAPSPENGFTLSNGQFTATEELSQMRRTKLGNLPVKQGSAEFFVLLAPGGKVEESKFISGAEHMRALSKVVTSIKFKAPLPDDAPVKLVRRGVLVCQGGNLGCDFTLFTVDSVYSTE
jgi:tetratricopeptide (TPR) repeat protein